MVFDENQAGLQSSDPWHFKTQKQGDFIYRHQGQIVRGRLRRIIPYSTEIH